MSICLSLINRVSLILYSDKNGLSFLYYDNKRELSNKKMGLSLLYSDDI